MNLPNFTKKKAETNKPEKKGNKPVRMDTEADQPFVDKRNPQRHPTVKFKKEEEDSHPQKTHKIERCPTSTGKADESAVTVMKAAKTTLHIK